MKWSGLYVLGLIGGISFAVSFDHVHELFASSGQGGWVGWALAVVVELLAAGSGLELVRRARDGESTVLPAGLLLLGAGMTLWGNLATAQAGPAGHLVAAFPAVATLGILATMETARAAAAGRREVPAEPRVHVPAVRVPTAAELDERVSVQVTAGLDKLRAELLDKPRPELDKPSVSKVQSKPVSNAKAKPVSNRRERSADYREAVRRMLADGVARSTANHRADAAETAGTLPDLLAQYPAVRPVESTA